MKAVQLVDFGSPENLRLVDIPTPEPGKDEVLIKVEAAGIIFSDILVRRGGYFFSPPLPYVPGREVAGTVEKVGSNLKDFKMGSSVMAWVLGGGYAEYALASPLIKTPHGATIDTGNLFELPERVSFSQGLIYLFNLRVAYLLIHFTADVKPGDFILLHAASGGMGTLMIKILKRLGANVIALSSSDEKIEYCMQKGADYGINYKKKDYVKEVMEITDGKGVDISFNSVAGPTFKSDSKALKPFGLLVVFGHAAGAEHIDPYEVMMHKSLTVKFSSIYSRMGTESYDKATEFLENWLRTEKLDNVSKVFKLEDAAKAHQWFEDGNAYGKIVLEP